MSSERFEYAEDELESVLERLASGLSQLEGSQGEARKRVKQVGQASILVVDLLFEASIRPQQARG